MAVLRPSPDRGAGVATEPKVRAGALRGSWNLVYDRYVPREEALREALCTTGNGYFATRGAAPESRADGVHYPGTYIAGCFNQLRTEVAGRAVESESVVNA